MPKFKCEICKIFEIKASSPPAKCGNCGNPDPTKWVSIKPPLLIFVGHSEKIIVFEEEKRIGRDHFKHFGGDSCQYASRNQFNVRCVDVTWMIEGIAGVSSPTLLNGKDISSLKEELKAGDVVEVGPLKLVVELGP